MSAALRAAMAPARCAAVRPVAFLGAAAPRRAAMAAPSRPFGGFAVAAPAPRTAAVVAAPTRRGALVVMANNKKSMGCTKEGTRRKSARVSGFRARMSSTNGKNTLARRRAKGRKVLCGRTVRKSAGKK